MVYEERERERQGKTRGKLELGRTCGIRGSEYSQVSRPKRGRVLHPCSEQVS